MKHLFLTSIICLLATFSSNAQFMPAANFTIDNRTNCDVFVKIFGTATQVCGSIPSTSTAFLRIPPGLHMYDNTAAGVPPGFVFGNYFALVEITDEDHFLATTCVTTRTIYSMDACNNANFSGVDLADNSVPGCCLSPASTLNWDTNTSTLLLEFF